jgi:hypothetical protein
MNVTIGDRCRDRSKFRRHGRYSRLCDRRWLAGESRQIPHLNRIRIVGGVEFETYRVPLCLVSNIRGLGFIHTVASRGF